MKYSELHKKLVEAGCYVIRQGGGHPIWYSCPLTSVLCPLLPLLRVGGLLLKIKITPPLFPALFKRVDLVRHRNKNTNLTQKTTKNHCFYPCGMEKISYL